MKYYQVQDIQMQTRPPVIVLHMGKNAKLNTTQNGTSQDDLECEFIIIGCINMLNAIF